MLNDYLNNCQTPASHRQNEENILDILIQTKLKAKDVVEELVSIEVVDKLLTLTRQQEAVIQELNRAISFQENNVRRANEEVEAQKQYYKNKCTETQTVVNKNDELEEKIKKLEKKLKSRKNSKK